VRFERLPPRTDVIERCYFSAGWGEPVYVRLYQPARGQVSGGVVLAAPVGRERLRFYREMASLARDLAAEGLVVLRFDYRGEGESAGCFSEATIRQRVDDTIIGAAELRRVGNVDTVMLVGVHVGASIAALAARGAAADSLVLCDPVTAPAAYVTMLMRACVVQQMQHFGRVVTTEPELRATLRAGGTTSIYGFEYGAELIAELERLDVSEALRAFEGPSLLVPFSTPGPETSRWAALLGAPGRCTVAHASGGFSWSTSRRWVPRLAAMNSAVLDWVSHSAARERPIA
jgi:alpha/beta superfamily hydrolase